MIKQTLNLARGRGALRSLAAALIVIAVSLPLAKAYAHGGEDHGDEKPAAMLSSGPRFDAHSDVFELVGIPVARDGGKLLVYLNAFWSNESVTGATVELTRGDETKAAKEVKGVYVIDAPWVKAPGHYDLTFAVTAGDASDLLIGRLDIPNPPPAAASHNSIWDHVLPQGTVLPSIPIWMLGGALGAALLMALAAVRGPRRARKAFLTGAAITGLSTVTMSAVVLSTENRRIPSAGSAVEAILDLPETSRRMEDGAVFVPKATQRLLGITTVQATTAQSVQKTVRLIGQVIPDPNRSGLVQALLTGRVEAPSGGFPAVGARVKKDDVLGYLIPQVAVVDQSDIRQTQGDLDQQITLAEAKLRRIEPLKGLAVPESQIIDARITLDALRKRRATIKPVLAEREELRAPADGLLSQANVTAGQVVEAQAILFQIVDPGSLWVEALAFDSASAANIAQSGKEALAQTADGRKVTLSFAGRSPSLRQQAVPLRFRIKTEGIALNVGEPVTVHAPIDEPVSAVTLPRSSVVRSSNGQSVVWAHAEAERFEARVVKTEPIDAERLGVTAGLDPGSRVVVRGAELINQVR